MIDAYLGYVLARLSHDLNKAEGLYQYVIFGSASLVIRGILDRTVGDIDVAVSKSVWGLILPMPQWIVQTPNAGDPPMLVLDRVDPPIHMFFDWNDTHVSMDLPHMIATADRVDGFRVAKVPDVLRHKKEALGHGAAADKHVPDIAIIEEYLR